MVNYDIPWTDPGLGIERTNVAHHCTRVQYRSASSLSLLHSSMPTRPCNRSHRARLIFSSNETNFAGRWRSNFHPYLRPRQFFRLYATSALSLSLSSSLLFPKVIRNGHEKDVKGWLLSVAIVASVISRSRASSRVISTERSENV